MNKAERQKQADEVFKRLSKLYGRPKPALDFTTEQEVWAAVILSAQCTDKRVNIVTKDLFKKYKSFEDYANADKEEFEKIIKPCGFYNAKTKALINGAKTIVEKHNSSLPNTLNGLMSLPGVGRKVGNVILSQWHKLNEGIAVDTHNIRVSQRLAISDNQDPAKIEQDMLKLFPTSEWNNISLLLIEHGRQICHARTPECSKCPLKDICRFYNKEVITGKVKAA